MLAKVLNTPRAVKVGVYVVRAFVRLRQVAAVSKEMASRLEELERRVAGHDDAVRSIVQAIRRLTVPPERARRSIEFRVEEGQPVYGLPQRVRRGAARRGVWLGKNGAEGGKRRKA